MSATSWSGDTRLREYGTESAFVEDDDRVLVEETVVVEDMDDVDNERAIPDMMPGVSCG